LAQVLRFAEFAKEPQDKIRQVFDTATSAQVRCPASEELAYLRVRSAELGQGAFLGEKLTPAADAEWRRLAHAVAQRFPRSARILTVDARGTNSVDTARRAVALDEHYVPAKVAVATALVAAGEADQAAKILDGLPGLETTSDGFTTLARARLATNDLQGAARAANMELTHRQPDLVEADAGRSWPIWEAHEIAALAAIGLKQYDEAARHLRAANPQSAKVRALLDHPPPALRKALHDPRSRRSP
jgi:hypothetical protein